jgi:multicomponent Na+:H+ antiporter subunit E
MRGESWSSLSRAAAVRGVLLGLGWWAISEGEPAGFGFGALVVVAATAVSLALSAPLHGRLRPIGCIRLAAWFLLGSLRGGIDVARRALSPRPELSPGLIRYETALEGRAQQLFMTMLSLMPGTQSVAAEQQVLFVHVLVRRDGANERDLSALEARIGAAFTRQP